MDFRSFRISVSKLSFRATSPALSLALFVVILGATSGCNNEPMTAPSDVIRNRVAAIRAEPPEISLGESTTLSALLVHPDPIPPALGQVWFACLETSSATGCLDMDFSSLGEGTEGGGDDESPPLQFGLGPSFEYRAEGSDVETAWEALEAEDRIEGLTVLVSVAYVEATNEELLALFASFATGDAETIADAQQQIESLMSEAILAARRIVISDKSGGQPDSIACEVSELIPNFNPSLQRLRGHLDSKGRDSGIELDDVTFAEPGDTLVLRPQLMDGSAEPYLFINRDGETECRKEAPYFAWLSNGGSHNGDYSFTADLEDLDETPGRPKVHSFVLPGEDDFTRPIDLWVVVRDRRGGVDWRKWSFSQVP